MQKEKIKSKGLRKARSLCRFRKIKEKIYQAKKTHQGAKASEINKLLTCSPHFIGCFAENQIEKLKITSFPCFAIVNLDNDKLPGSHWIALHFKKNKIEIWDTLGLRLLDWPTVPCNLLKFLHNHVISRRITVSRRIQHDSSILCGYYCIFFVICRPFMSFSSLVNMFSSNFAVNDNILIKFFS